MRLTDTVSRIVNGIATRLVRDAIVYGLCAVCGIVIIIMATQAAVLATKLLGEG